MSTKSYLVDWCWEEDVTFWVEIFGWAYPVVAPNPMGTLDVIGGRFGVYYYSDQWHICSVNIVGRGVTRRDAVLAFEASARKEVAHLKELRAL